MCARGTFGGDEVDADECCDTAEYEFQETGGGCRVEVFVEDGRAEDDGEGKHDELGGYHLLTHVNAIGGNGGGTVDENRARALLRYFTWRTAVVVNTKRRR